MPWFLIAAGYGDVRIGTPLRYVSVTPTLGVTYWYCIVVGAISITVAVVVVASGGGCYCGEHRGSEVGRCGGGNRIGDL